MTRLHWKILPAKKPAEEPSGERFWKPLRMFGRQLTHPLLWLLLWLLSGLAPRDNPIVPFALAENSIEDLSSKDTEELIQAQERMKAAYGSLDKLNPLSAPTVVTALNRLSKNPNRMYALYAEIGWTLFFFVFRAWRSSKLTPRHWLRALWLKVWTTLVYLGVVSILLPSLVFGEDYFQLLSVLIHTLGLKP